YHSLSPFREKSPSYWLEPADVIWSNRPLIVTFGVGAWANAAGATSPRMATRQATTATVLLMLPPQLWCVSLTIVAQKRHHQQKQTSDNVSILPWGVRERQEKCTISGKVISHLLQGFSGVLPQPGRTGSQAPAPGPAERLPGPPGAGFRPSGRGRGCSSRPAAWGRG